MRRGRTGEADGQPATLAARHLVHVRLQRLQPLQLPARQGQQFAASCGELHALGMALEQRGTDFGFEAADLLAQWRLRQAQLFGRARDVAGVSHRHEVPQVPQLHIANV